ncbi:MAG TPA: type II toxin-antitoxin system VapC family toxin [Pyrinomonadaceae bacterium]|jgi:predicted nucleic acid-binding protein|nr:type II toxin-antitoxin system VapC family toxin [Pyrinomonadaceae bacterium]
MAAYFFDRSALVKLYVNEAGTAWLKSLTAQHTQNSFFIARITDVEVVSALARRGRAGSLDPSALQAALRQFNLDLTQLYLHVEINQTLTIHAMSLAETNALRGYDAVQLAAALEVCNERRSVGLPTPALISADAALNAAAIAEGLTIDNPNDH